METGRPSGRIRLLAAALLLAAAAGSAGSTARADEALPAPAAGEAAAGASSTPGAAPEAGPAAHRRFARSLWFDLRGRGPTPGELDLSASLPGPELVDHMLADPETWEAWLDRECWYYLLIDRFRPVSDRVKALPAKLAFGSATVVDATREVVVSAEFNSRNPGNDTFVTVVLEQLAGVVVQKEKRLLEAGKRMYDGTAARMWGELGRTQADIVRIVLGRREFADRFLGRQYRQVFGAEPPPGALDRDGARFMEDPASFRDVLRGWLLSPDYAARTAVPRPKDDLVFIRTLFVDLLGREPDFEEFRNSRNALLALSDPTPVRHVLAQLLLDSGKAPLPDKASLERPPEWIRGKFRDLLGREPTRGELETFTAVLGEYTCETKTVVMALVTSAEYQYH